MDVSLTLLLLVIAFLSWRIRSTMKMLEDWRDDERYGHS
jgi:hypothetical protein